MCSWEAAGCEIPVLHSGCCFGGIMTAVKAEGVRNSHIAFAFLTAHYVYRGTVRNAGLVS